MTVLELSTALSRLRPGATFNIRGDTIEWLDANTAAPSADELAAAHLASLKAAERAAVNEAAEEQRLKRITGGATKAMEYMEARDQAVAVLAMGEAAANALPNHGFAEFPVLSASVPIEAASLYAAAQLVSGRYELYVSIAGQIKAKAIAAKAAITAATTEDQVRAVRGAIVWP